MADRWRALCVAGKEVVVVVLDVPPYGGSDPTALYAKAIAGAPVSNLTRPLAEFEAKKHSASTRLAAAARAAGVRYVDPACPDARCPIVVTGRTLYTDAEHLRATILKELRFAIYDAIIAPAAYAAQGVSPVDR